MSQTGTAELPYSAMEVGISPVRRACSDQSGYEESNLNPLVPNQARYHYAIPRNTGVAPATQI